MDFEFSDEQLSLREAVSRWVDKGFTFERRHSLARAGGHAREVWRELADLGLCGLAVSENHGGLGFGPIEAMVVMEELGRGLVHVPYAAAALVAPALMGPGNAALVEPWLSRMAAGDALVVPALQERAARYQCARVQTTAREQGGVYALQGHKSVVPAGDEADAFIVPARWAGAPDAERGIGLFLVERTSPGVSVRGYPTQDGSRAAELALANAPGLLIELEGFDTLLRALDIGIAAVCAEGTGLMDRLVAITAEYMNTRKQFGVPIASFQALRHRMADVKMQLELARSMSYFAHMKLGEPRATRRRALSQAKVQLGQSMRWVGQQCIQLHGGIGVTDEYIASHCFKRLTLLEMTGGDTLHHLGEVSAAMQDTAGVFA